MPRIPSAGFENRSKIKCYIGEGVVGVIVHLVKTLKNPTIHVKDKFPIRSCRDDRILAPMGRIATKFCRRVLSPKL